MHPDTFVLAGTLGANIMVFTFTFLCFSRVRKVREDFKYYVQKCEGLHEEEGKDREGT